MQTQHAQPATDRFIPVSDVQSMRVDRTTVLRAPDSEQGYPLSELGAEVWSLLQGRPRTVDRLVMTLARRSTGQALALVPDHVVAELDRFITQGLVRRVAA
jgi:hypothetical protein